MVFYEISGFWPCMHWSSDVIIKLTRSTVISTKSVVVVLCWVFYPEKLSIIVLCIFYTHLDYENRVSLVPPEMNFQILREGQLCYQSEEKKPPIRKGINTLHLSLMLEVRPVSPQHEDTMGILVFSSQKENEWMVKVHFSLQVFSNQFALAELPTHYIN